MPREPFSAAGSPPKGRSRWTPQLLKAFEDATDALGPAAAPAAVLEHMGPAAADLTRDAVAAHLQKHRSGVLRSGSRKSLDGRRSLDMGGSGGAGCGLKSLRTRSVPNMASRPCRRSPRTPKTPKAAPPPPSPQSDEAVQPAADRSSLGPANATGNGQGADSIGCGMDPAWRLPPAQPPTQWCLGPAPAAAAAAYSPACWQPAAAVAAHSWALSAAALQGPAPWPLQGCATVTTGAGGAPLQGGIPPSHVLLPAAVAAAAGTAADGRPCSSPGSGSASSTVLADGSAHAAEAAAAAMAAAAAAAATTTAQDPLPTLQPAAADRAATHSPEGCGAAAGGFGAAFDAAAETSFELLGGLSASDDSDTELWSMAELTAAALSIPPEVLAEADLPLLLPEVDSAASTPCSALPFGLAADATPRNTAWGAVPHPAPPASPASYAPFGPVPPPPFRTASGIFGCAGADAFATGPAGKLLQEGPGRMACISAPAACMQSAAALDAVHYAARHAHMLQDLRGRPTEPPIGLKLDKESVLEELRATAV